MYLTRNQFLGPIGAELNKKSYLRWEQRAPAPSRRLAFNFPTKHESDKVAGYFKIANMPSSEGVELSFYSPAKLLAGFVLKQPSGEIEVHDTEEFRSVHLLELPSGLTVQAYNNYGRQIRTTLSPESTLLLAGHMVEVASLGYLAHRHVDAVN